MRKFSIYFNGTETKLNGEEGFSFNNPQGLGINLSPDMVNLRNGFFKPTAKDVMPQITIVGDLTFMGGEILGIHQAPYEQYQYFLALLQTVGKIEFAYTPHGSTEYRILVELDYMTKSEMSGSWLTCGIAFRALTPWYNITQVDVPLTSDVQDTNLYKAEITSVGNMGAAFVITANGGTPNAIIVEEALSGEVQGAFSLDTSKLIAANGTFEYSTLFADAYAIHTLSGVKTDLVNRALMNNYDIFPRLRPFVKSNILVLYSAGITKPTTISAAVYNYYRSV